MTTRDDETTAELVADLLREQHPDLADRPLTFGAHGWDNQIWRLGDDLAVRLPWATHDAGDLLVNEHRWVPEIAPRLPLPVPVPQRLGVPSERFPHPWIVTTWVAGAPADRAPVTSGATSAEALASFLGALHRPAPGDAPVGRQGRGGRLDEVGAGLDHQLRDAADRRLVADPDAVADVWADASSAPSWQDPDVWLHADLHPANVLTSAGDLCGVIDFGDLCAGDPACDLAAAWILLPDEAVERFWDARPTVDDATWRRARGWAVGKALTCLLIGDAGVHGRPGGKATWGSPADASLRRLVATR